MPTEAILRVWDELSAEEAASDAYSAHEQPVPNGLPRPVRWEELVEELGHRGISEQFIQVESLNRGHRILTILSLHSRELCLERE